MKFFHAPLLLVCVIVLVQCKEDEEEDQPINSLLPKLSTLPVDSVNNTGAIVSGVVTSQGGSAVTVRGICYSTSPNPSLEDSFTTEIGATDSFSSTITGLEEGALYFARAYGVNSSGTGYGNEINFLTDVILQNNLTASTSSIDFSSGNEVFFNAEFSREVNWSLKITGTESGAIKEFNGNGMIINESNSSWDGAASASSIFLAEQCEVTLTSADYPNFAETIQIEVLGPKPLGGDLITDFEQDLGPSLFIGDFEFELSEAGQVQNENTIQGSSYLYMEGTDNSSGGPTDNLFVGLARLFPSLEGNTYFSAPSTDPSQLYFNVLVFNELPYSRLVVSFKVDSNDNGQFDNDTDNSFSFEYDGIFDSPAGWNDLNVSMDEIGLSSTALTKIVAIEFVLISLNNIQPTPREPVGFGLDYLSFSVGEPLDF